MKRPIGLLAALAAAAVLAWPSTASAQIWTNWTGDANAGTNGGTFSGTLGSTSVTFTGLFQGVTSGVPCGGAQGSQLSNDATDCNYWTNPNDYTYTQHGLTAPSNPGFIQFVNPGSGSIVFGTAVVNPYIAFTSVGQGGDAVTFDFTNLTGTFNVLSNNNVGNPQCPYWTCGTYSASTTGPYSLTGTEFSGTVQFVGTYTEIDFTTDVAENWYGLTVGADAVTGTVTPEPATMSLVGLGLVGLMGVGRRRKRSV